MSPIYNHACLLGADNKNGIHREEENMKLSYQSMYNSKFSVKISILRGEDEVMGKYTTSNEINLVNSQSILANHRLILYLNRTIKKRMTRVLAFP